MAQRPRDIAAGVFHVYTHCVWASERYFYDDVDRMTFLRELARVTARSEWKCLAYCLMRSHYHLIVEVQDGVLPKAMQSLNWRYAMHFNTRHAMRGTTQFRRYGARRIQNDDDLVGCFTYVSLNPVDAGLCNGPAEWPWSSYAATAGLAPKPSFLDDRPLLACFHDVHEFAVAALREYVESRDRAVTKLRPVPGSRRGSAGHVQPRVANGREISYVWE
jgi:REP element-mobilizing transposase RayT